MAEPAKITVSNQKRGVGKTAIAINAAGALIARGRDVLFVDLDPQGNATENLGLREAYDSEPPSLFDILSDSEQRDRIGELVREHEEMSVTRRSST
nr:ParA family protein [Haloarcula sp. S1CR25-12]